MEQLAGRAGKSKEDPSAPQARGVRVTERHGSGQVEGPHSSFFLCLPGSGAGDWGSMASSHR